MHYYLIAPLKIARANASSFTYGSSDKLKTGHIVLIELGKKQVIGVVIADVQKPSFATKPVVGLIENEQLPTHLIKLAQWLSDYYATHLATVLQTVLPAGIGKKRRERGTELELRSSRKRTKIVLNSDQEQALNIIADQKPKSILLHGITGSGKTEIYKQAALKNLQSDRSSIILVPEIALTAQLVDEFSQVFKDQLVVTHSTMGEAERHLVWQQCLNSKKPLVIIGPRSALFSPAKNLGLIIVDECHEPSYKQDQSPRYSALRLASKMAQLSKATVVFGSATPSIQDYYLAEQTDAKIIKLNKSAKVDTQKADVTLVDLTDQSQFARHRFFSNQLLKSIESNAASGAQTLLFHNRRGSAPFTLCENCGWTAACPNCHTPQVLHTDSHRLICHACGRNQPVPPNCPACSQPDVVHRGIGTKLIVEELAKIFTKLKIARFDGDSLATERLHEQYPALYDGSVNVIVGTQSVAKGLDLPHLKTVGVIQADNGLSLPDFQSEERVFQLIHQVVGRVGRDKHASDVIVQTYQPSHPSVQFGISQNYDEFYKYAIKKRRADLFPPFRYLLKLTCSYKTEVAAIKNAKILQQDLKKLYPGLTILGPAPAFYERLNGNYRWQLILKSPSRTQLLDVIKNVPANHWQIDIDPASLL